MRGKSDGKAEAPAGNGGDHRLCRRSGNNRVHVDLWNAALSTWLSFLLILPLLLLLAVCGIIHLSFCMFTSSKLEHQAGEGASAVSAQYQFKGHYSEMTSECYPHFVTMQNAAVYYSVIYI